MLWWWVICVVVGGLIGSLNLAHGLVVHCRLVVMSIKSLNEGG